jgi:hypothetical protein
MTRAIAVLVCAIACVSGLTVHAHHSFASTYKEDQRVEIEGSIVTFLFRNPHSYVHVMAPDDEGKMQRWAIEWAGAGQLGTQGLTRDTLKVGDRVVIMGSPGRNAAEHRIRMRTLRRLSDGFQWGQRPNEVVD